MLGFPSSIGQNIAKTPRSGLPPLNNFSGNNLQNTDYPFSWTRMMELVLILQPKQWETMSLSTRNIMRTNIPHVGYSQSRGNNVPSNPPPQGVTNIPPNMPPQGGINPPTGFPFPRGSHLQSVQYIPPSISRNIPILGGVNPPQQGTPILPMGNPYQVGGYEPMGNPFQERYQYNQYMGGKYGASSQNTMLPLNQNPFTNNQFSFIVTC